MNYPNFNGKLFAVTAIIVFTTACKEKNYFKLDTASRVKGQASITKEGKSRMKGELFPDTTLNYKEQSNDLADTTNFKIVKEYIRKTGEKSQVNISSSIADTLMVTYYTVYLEGMEVIIDHSNRIYMNLNGQHYGNLLKLNNIVVPEINYGVPDKTPELTKEKEAHVLELYNKLLTSALKGLDNK